MNFEETLAIHLRALQERDLPTLRTTLPPTGDLTMILPSGQIHYTVAAFIAFHEQWFAQTDWTLTLESQRITSTPELGLAALIYHYQDSKAKLRIALSLVFRCQEGTWQLIHDQNTLLPNACVPSVRDKNTNKTA